MFRLQIIALQLHKSIISFNPILRKSATTLLHSLSNSFYECEEETRTTTIPADLAAKYLQKNLQRQYYSSAQY